MRTSVLVLVVAILAGLVLARENRQGGQSKEPGANTATPPGDRKSAVAAGSASQIYKSVDFGFSFSYPADWFIFEHVNTFYIERGLPTAFNLCLTTGPVKELRCDIDLFVLPERQFKAPATVNSSFMGLAVAQPDINLAPRFGSVAGRIFAVTYTNPSLPIPRLIYNHYVVQNGFVYLWVYSGTRADRSNTVDASRKMLNSFHFFAPVK
jgi:hypothetical protein